MDNITKMWMGPLPNDSPYVKPFRLYYVQNGVEKNWDLLEVHDSIAIILYNSTRRVLIFVRQFRPAVYHSKYTGCGYDAAEIDLKRCRPNIGITLELCVGILDPDKGLHQNAREAVLEECGYDVPLDGFEQVMSYRSGVGSFGAAEWMFYSEVTDDDQVTKGGGVGDKIIEVVEYTIPEAANLLSKGGKVNSPPSCLLGIAWFLMNKAPKKN